IVWAVVDSGIDGSHPHFRTHRNLELPAPLKHCDFTTFGDLDGTASEGAALTDQKGHGTQVAGIIAGALTAGDEVEIKATVNKKDEHGRVLQEERRIEAISGMAPACKLVSFKVLDKDGRGQVSNLIAACEKIQEINDNGRHIRIHGVNMSVGYDFEPSWFTSGQSPLCVEIDGLVRSGVVVVVAAGNTGY
ncbi:MAG: peptidase in kexin sedolisin, partial [Nitrobacter vulgaris]|nr:peptidase in kexin sedolisin [Nitrobacter vulgaris]